MTNRFSALSAALVVTVGQAVLVSCQPAGEGGMEQTAVDTAAIMSAADSLRVAYEEDEAVSPAA